MRAAVVLAAVAAATVVSASSARAETFDANDAPPPPTTGKIYASLAWQTVVFSSPPDQMIVSYDHPVALEGGLRVGDLPVFAHAVVATSSMGYRSAAIGPELRAGNIVKGVFGVDIGYQNDPRGVDSMYSVDGVFVAPRIGLEIGSRALWARAVFEGRSTLRSGPSGSAGALTLAVGHDF
ncbi:MAG TPA: hypothetical protein VLB44_06330 [Kofleriaceae bacterium]|nr:hypothetical protein [Kofleriaceae bacterium]